MDKRNINLSLIFTLLLVAAFAANVAYCQDDDDTMKNVLKQGLLGAGTGAIASGASGGKAGQGALIGAGTGIIGSMLLDAVTKPSAPRYRQAAPPPQGYYPAAQQGAYYPANQGQDYYYEEPPPQESSSQKVLKQGLLGAGTGAIASGASGGNAGTGALIGAGTGVIGGALLDAISQPSQPRRVYRGPPPQAQQVVQPQVVQVQQPQNVQVQDEVAGAEGGHKRVIKKYDANGKLVSEEEVYY